MVKRLLTLMLALALILSVSAAFTQDGAANAASSTTSSGETADSMIMYVYTDNGQGLNVRRSPFVGNNIIGLAPYGSEVHVIRFLNNGWACIEWDNYTEAYVQSRFLQWYKPGTNVTPTAPAAPTAPNTVPTAPNNTPVAPTYAPPTNAPTATATAKPTATPTATPYTYSDTLAALNAEFRTARLVSPFTIVVRPARASGWVNMRWAPSKDVEVLSTYRSGAQLTVIAETQSWYQVADPDTEATGFIMKAYTTRLN